MHGDLWTCTRSRASAPVLPERVELMTAGFCFFSAALHARNCSSVHCRYFLACKAQ